MVSMKITRSNRIPCCLAGNWEEVNRLCTHGKAFASVVSQSKGWAMVNEGDEFKPKYGYVTHQVGMMVWMLIIGHCWFTVSGLEAGAQYACSCTALAPAVLHHAADVLPVVLPPC
jgi:hypothetical protein